MADDIYLYFVSRDGGGWNNPLWRMERWSGEGDEREMKESQSMPHTAVLKMTPLWEEAGHTVHIPAYESREVERREAELFEDTPTDEGKRERVDGDIYLYYVSKSESEPDNPTWRVERWSGEGDERELMDKQFMSHKAVLKMTPLWEERGFRVHVESDVGRTELPRRRS